VVRAKAKGEGNFTVRRGEGKVKKGGVDEKKVNEGVGAVVLPSDGSVRNCEKKGVVVNPFLEDGCPWGE
jgi:hypothetical protein